MKKVVIDIDKLSVVLEKFIDISYPRKDMSGFNSREDCFLLIKQMIIK